MGGSNRCVQPEELDALDAQDPRAQRSRRDLKRVHAAMGSVAILKRAIASLRLTARPQRVLELGAGDGTLLLRVARALRPPWSGVQLTLLDRLDLVSAETRAGYAALGWDVTVDRTDVLDWSAGPRAAHYDLCFANLFLHHFEAPALAGLLHAVAASSNAFIAAEPRRSGFAALGSRLMFVLGANAVTRDDAVKSVAAGFTGDEIARAWGKPPGGWNTREYWAPPFTHCFTAVRSGAGTSHDGV